MAKYEVNFNAYCPICVYKDNLDTMEPCTYCLDNAYNIDSKKPVKFKLDEKEKPEWFPEKTSRKHNKKEY